MFCTERAKVQESRSKEEVGMAVNLSWGDFYNRDLIEDKRRYGIFLLILSNGNLSKHFVGL